MKVCFLCEVFASTNKMSEPSSVGCSGTAVLIGGQTSDPFGPAVHAGVALC